MTMIANLIQNWKFLDPRARHATALDWRSMQRPGCAPG